MDLRRESLLERIKASSAQLILVQAPAGYGKSSLLRQIAQAEETSGSRIAWITPASQDADLSRFMQMFTLACESLIAASGGESHGNQRSIPELIKSIDGPALLVLDEYDQFASDGADAFLKQVVETLPADKKIALAARSMPDISCARLKLQGRAIILGSVDLRFDLAEAYHFLAEKCRFSLDEVRRLYSRIDGWPAALQFIALAHASRRGKSTGVRGELTHDVVEYLASEVFLSQDGQTQADLLAICLPDRLCAKLVQSLTGRARGEDLLWRLHDAGLFLDPVGGSDDWFRFHPLFGDFLRGRLEEEIGTAALSHRHQQIADWFASSDMREVAITHYLAAGSQDHAVECLEQTAEQLVREERLGVLVSQLEQLDPLVIQNSPSLLGSAVTAYGFRRQFEAAHKLLHLWEAVQSDEDADATRRAQLEVSRCFVLAAEDRISEMGARASDALRNLGDEQAFSKAVAYNAYAFWLGAQSQFPEAHELLLQAIPLHEKARSYFGRSYAESIHASLKLSEGQVGEAIEDMRRALHELETDGPVGIAAGGVIAAHLGEALYERNELEEAESVILAYLPQIQQQCIVDPLCLGIVTLARIAVINGRREYAHELYEHLISTGHRHGLARLVNCGRSELAREATLEGDFETVARRLRALGSDGRMPTEGQLVFVSSELEAQRITYARFLVHSGQHAEARAILQAEIRTAAATRRNRRLVRLKTLLAVSLSMDAQAAYARRTMLEAVTLAEQGGMERIFLDEGPAAIRLLTLLAEENLAHSPDWANDRLAPYVRRIVAIANGESPQASGEGERDEGVCDAESPGEELTARELEMLQFLARGHSNRELADRFAVSQNTVKYHLRNVFAKLGVTNRMQAVQAARHYQLIS